jgi:CshA-type fibril repeat protein
MKKAALISCMLKERAIRILIVMIISNQYGHAQTFFVRPTSGAANTPYTLRYSDVLKGGVLIAGNTNTTRNLSAPYSRQVDIDNDNSTFNSSSEELIIPAGATVKRAYLYWQSTCYSTGAVYDISNPPAGRTSFTNVKFKTPGSSTYSNLVPDTAWQSGYYFWQGMKVVTDAVRQAGSGIYTIANIDADPTPPGTNGYLPYAGWSLWVEYEDPTEVWKSVTLTDGLSYVTAGNTAITVTGFKIPAVGALPITGEAGWFVGHANIEWGDALTYDRPAYPGYPSVTNSFFSDNANPVNNPLNESRSYKGAPVTNFRNPASHYSYGLGGTPSQVGMAWFDLDVIDISSLLVPQQTQFTLKFYPQGNSNPLGCAFPGGCDDWNVPGYVYSAVEIVQPVAINDTSAANTPGLPVTINILNNDLDVNGLAPVPGSNMAIDIDTTTPGNQITKLVPGEGQWNYNTVTGLLTFTPDPGFIAIPTPLTYRLTETVNGLWSQATVYILYEPISVNDQAWYFLGLPVSVSILSNDELSDDSTAVPAQVTVDIDPSTPGDQTMLAVPNQGTWSYDPGSGLLKFTPLSTFTGLPTPITYTLKEDNTGLVSSASVTLEFGALLPINLIYFDLAEQNSSVLLSWATAQGSNSNAFIIERSPNQQTLTPIDTVLANGVSNTTSAYAYADKTPLAGTSFYRLNLTNKAGPSDYSEVRTAEYPTAAAAGGVTFYPNPVKGTLGIMTSRLTQIKQVQLFNVSGACVYTSKGTVKKQIDLHQLSSGAYTVRLTFADGTTSASIVEFQTNR